MNKNTFAMSLKIYPALCFQFGPPLPIITYQQVDYPQFWTWSQQSNMTKSKTPAAHPGFTNMISAAIVALKSRTGSSRAAILKYIVANYKVETANPAINVRISLKRMVASGALKMAKASGKGAGCYKVDKVEKPKKVKKAKKPAAKKPKAKKAAKKPAAKKAAKKPAAKKPAAKKPAAKKPAAKTAAKKAAAKKK